MASPRAVGHAAAPAPIKQVFMTVSGITGDVTNTSFPGAVALASYSVGATSPPPAVGGGGVGKATFKDLTVTYQADRSLPPLAHDVYAGIHVPSVLITELDATAHTVRTVTLTNAFPDNVQMATGAPGQSLVTVGFNYAQIQTTDFVNPDGANPTPITTCWNVANNVAC
jgi:type VI secretion system secreted protein Hcp